MANLKNNTTTIQSILETVNTLPNAGSGGGINVSGVTAAPADVLAPKVFVDANGNKQTGILTTEELTGIEPTTEEQTFTPDSGKLYSKVIINAIDPNYIIPEYTQEENIWTPTTKEQTIPAGTYCSGAQTIGAIPEDYVKPTGTLTITTNGTHDVANYASAKINVPIPSGYIKPSGTLNITTNGTHTVTNYANANVNVPIPNGYVQPTGTKTITTNGTHDVSNYASATVNIAGGNIGSRVLGSYTTVNGYEAIKFSLAVNADELAGFMIVYDGGMLGVELQNSSRYIVGCYLNDMDIDSRFYLYYQEYIVYSDGDTSWANQTRASDDNSVSMTITNNIITIITKNEVRLTGKNYYLYPFYKN